MNGINSIPNAYDHFKTISLSNNELTYNLKPGNTVLPSITNLSNASTDGLFNSYINSSNVTTNNNDYSNNIGSLHFSLPTMRGFSQMPNQHYFHHNTNGFTEQSCTVANNQYHYPEFSYNTIVSDRNWIDPYPSECLKPSTVPAYQNCYESNRLTDVNTSMKNVSTKSTANIKDEKYSLRRQKNNLAAKKCRDNKKLKNQEVSDLILQYETDNENLKLQIHSVKMAIEELMKQLQ